MVKKLTPNKLKNLAESLTGKECALLCIEYVLRGEKDGNDYKEEVETISSTISPYDLKGKRSEFNFYYKLFINCGIFSLDLQTAILELQILNGHLNTLRTMLFHDCVNYHNLTFFHRLPAILTEEEVEELYQQYRSELFSEVLPIEQAAKYEAFLKLKKDDFLDEDDDFEAVAYYYEEDSNKSYEELLSEKAKEIKDYLKQEEERTKRGTVSIGEAVYKEYVGMTQKEIIQNLKENEEIDIPEDKEVKKWKETVESELSKLKTAIKKEKLQKAKVKDKTSWYHNGERFIGKSGITGESWYRYKDKRDVNFNTFADDKYNLVEFYRGNYVVAKTRGTARRVNKEKVCSAEESRRDLEKRLEDGLVLEEKDGWLDLKNKKIKQGFFRKLSEAQDLMQKIVNHTMVIKEVEEKIFDNAVTISRNLINEGKSLINQVAADQEKAIDIVVKDYNFLAFFQEIRLRDRDKYRLSKQIEPDEDWVEERVQQLIDISERETGYVYRN